MFANPSTSAPPRHTARDDRVRGSGGWITALQALLVIVAVLLIAIVHYHGQTLARGPDQADMLLAIFHEASHAIADDGLWAAMVTDDLRAGISNWSNPNLHVLYPLYFNWIGADASVFDTLDRLNAIIYLHLAILGGGGFVFARMLGVRLLPALAVGLLMPWFPAVRAAAQWPQVIAGMAWLPWLLAAQVALSTSNGRRDARLPAIGLAVAATLLVYAQPAQNLVFAAIASAVLWTSVVLHALWRRDREATRRLMRQCAWLALAAALVAAASGAYLLEVLRFHAQSIRWLGEYGGVLVGDQPVPVGALLIHALKSSDAGLLVAFEYRRGVGNAYLGAALAASALALLLVRDRHAAGTPAMRGLLACAVVATLFCFAVSAPLIVLLPLANKVRELIWWSCLGTVLVVPLAALGLQSTVARRQPARAWRDPLAWLFAAVLVPAAAATAELTAHRIEAFAALLVGFVAVAFVVRSRAADASPSAPMSIASRPRDLASVAVLLAAVWMPFRHNIEFARRDATLFEPDRVQARADAAQLKTLLPDADDYRIALPGLPNAHLLTHSYATAGLRALQGGIGPAVYAKNELLSQPSPTVARLYGLKYTLWSASAARPGDRRLRAGLVLRTDDAALPRLFFVEGGLRVVDDPVAILRTSPDATPAQALVARRDLAPAFDIAPFAHGTPTLRRPSLSEDRRTRLRATLDSRAAGMLILNEDPDGRWRARIDGRPVPALRVNGFQTGFPIAGGGRHAIEIERPGPLFGRSE